MSVLTGQMEGFIPQPQKVENGSKRARKNRVEKSDSAFRTISEVADDLGVAQHVLRFWESKFKEIEPLKRGGGRRYYRPDDIELVRKIHNLLYNEGFTIRGVQKLLKNDKRLFNVESKNVSIGNNMASGYNNTRSSAVENPPLPKQFNTRSSNSIFDGKNNMDDTTRKALKVLLEDLKSLRSLVL